MRLSPLLLPPLLLPPLLLAPLLLATLLLAGCHGDPNEEAVQCPKPFALPDASRLARYDGRGSDLSNLVLSARITDVAGACTGKLGVKQEAAHAHVVMIVTRGPAARSAEADIAYKVGVMQANQILAENAYVQHVVFPPNVATLQVTGKEIPMVLPLSKDITGPSYHLYFWLQLSPAELQANRRHPEG